ncbi:peptidylprolyl isomerase [Parasphingopyxis lamellibrachiae]|uniref:Parvulin-like PPIase n=1 Tax=Parasphingopyxis lamellibrachiae TaxID=680125 RepID=A0A3D9FEY0_9SPHN|nr:peptidylprolyl isomerase [Parasphingopyxis lamellibrachiae]RED15636.1 periplasmic chaperone for outer membrane proteins SurA [Parasphingopyxis lamellibrachiae]
MRRTFKIFAVAGLAALVTTHGAAQQTQEDIIANTAAQLGLPSTFTVFGNRDPNIRTPTAIVNGEIITRTDVDQRLNLFLAANANARISEEERTRLRMQIVRNLIDEMLQIQEARANDIVITPAEINQTFTQVAERNGSTMEDFDEFLEAQGSSARTMRKQIEGELAWRRLLRRYVNPTVGVSDAEVQAIVDRLEASRGQTEYRVAEIYLPARPDNQEEMRQGAMRLLQQIQSGGSFQAYARQFSQASTAAVGGDLGWLRPGQLPAELAAVVTQMPVGGVSQPIPIPGGFSIIALIDQRQVLVGNPRDAVLSLTQITLSFEPGTAREVAEPRIEAFAAATQAGGGCGASSAIASEFGGEVVQNDGIRLGDLPEVLQQNISNLQVGQATAPFGSLDDGVRVLILCGRDDPPASAEPDAEVILNRLEQERADRRARRYLRDLRRDAVIEYR